MTSSVSDPEQLVEKEEGNNRGRGREGRRWELDFEEVVKRGRSQRRVSEEDEVKVHASGNIEESSGEEGEIKDGSEESVEHTQAPDSSPCQQTTPPVDIISDPDQPPALVESESERQGVGEGAGQEEREEEEEEEEDASELETTPSEKVTASPRRETKLTSVCRHFLQGKCSWGKDCRFSHDERALSRHPDHHSGPNSRPLPPPPPRGHRFMGDPFIHPPGPPAYIGLPPPAGAGPHPPPPPPLPRDPFYLPYEEHGVGGKGVSQVAEESEGWYRLRTVATNWSSDEDRPHHRAKADLRDDLNKKRLENSVPSNNSEDEKQQTRKKKKVQKAQREGSPSRSSEGSEVEVGQKKRQRGKGHSASKSRGKKRSQRQEDGSSCDEKKKRKKRHRSSSMSSDGEPYPVYPYHGHPHHPIGPPVDRYLPPHRPPDTPFPPYGPPRMFPGPPGQRHLPIDPYGPPPLPPHAHDHYFDHYGSSYRGYDWHRPHRSPPPHPPRDYQLGPRGRSGGRWSPTTRHRKSQRHSSESSDSSPDHKHHRKKSREHSEKPDKTLNRKEQLLKELSVINRVIERKKQKKGS